jgi:signal transduction histidine kinase
MRTRSWWVLYGGFGSLVILIAVLGVGAMRRARVIHNETIAAHDAYLKADLLVRELPADLHLSGVLVRDYLLDPSPFLGPDYRARLKRQESAIQNKLELLRLLLPGDQASTLARLKTEFDAYWNSLDPLFEWSLEQKAWMSRSFLREEVLPRRNAIIALATEISRISSANIAAEQKRLQATQESFQEFIRRLLVMTMLLGLIVAAVSIMRVTSLETRSSQQRARAEQAELEMRRLSHSLVQAQEEERKSISRELHDALGQKLSFAGMELSRLQGFRDAPGADFQQQLEDVQRLITEAIRTVRDMSMSLRPAMLDELGLGAAVRWQAREFARRSGMEVDVQLDGDLEGLPDAHRTGIYRVVQETLTNCARHSEAKNVRIRLYGSESFIRLTVQDDGVGFDAEKPREDGLGLIGIRERVSELGGQVVLKSTPGKGTILEVEAPIAEPARAAS